MATKGFVHRDLAARSVLLGDNKVVKVADFGLSRHLYEDAYQTKNAKKLPMKWMPPESIATLRYDDEKPGRRRQR